MSRNAISASPRTRRQYDSIFSAIFDDSSEDVDAYFARRPVVQAFVLGEYALCERLADKDGSLPAMIVAATAAMYYGVTMPTKRGEFAERVRDLRASSSEATTDQEFWIRFLEAILLLRDRTILNHFDSLEKLRDEAAAHGVLDVVWQTQLAMIEMMNTEAAVDRMDILATQLESELDPDDVTRWRLTLIRGWTAADVGDDRAHLKHCEVALALMERLPYRLVFYESITLRETAQAAQEMDRIDTVQRIVAWLGDKRWPESVDYFYAYARYHVASMLSMHGDTIGARRQLDLALETVTLVWARFRILLERTRLSMLVPSIGSYEAEIVEVCRIADEIDWTQADKYDRLLLLELAELTAPYDLRKARVTREVFRSRRTIPERVFKFRSEIKTMLGERTLSGIAEAATGNTYEALAKLTDAVTAWQQQLMVPWRAATAAYHLAKLTGDSSHVARAQALLERWPQAPITLDLARRCASQESVKVVTRESVDPQR